MKYIIILYFSLAHSIIQVMSQVSISSNIGKTELVCPGSPTNYSVSLPNQARSCSISWQITKGSGRFSNGDNRGSQVTVIWDDQKPNKVELKVLVSYHNPGSGDCNSPQYANATFTHVLRSVFGETIPNVVSQVNVPYCNNQPKVTLNVGPLYIKKTGGVDEPPLTAVEGYEWQLPSGWRRVGTGQTGSFFTRVNSIIIEPTNPGGVCTRTSTVGVTGIAGGDNNCLGQIVSLSKKSSIVLRRTPDPSTLVVSAPPDFTSTACGNGDPITFTATSISCAIRYSWDFPSGWRQQSISSNTITLIPAGKPEDAGPISAKAILPCGTVDIRPFIVNFEPPYMVSPKIICSSGSNVTLENVGADVNVTWSVSGSLRIIAGQGTRNAVIRAATPNTKALGTISVIVDCPNTTIPSKTVWAGKPRTPLAFRIRPRPSSIIQPNTYVIFRAEPVSSDPSFDQQGVSAFSWFPFSPNDNARCTSSCSAREATILVGPGPELFNMKNRNVCGYSDVRLFEIPVTQENCPPWGCDEPFIVIHPNPSTKYFDLQLNLTEDNMKKGYEVRVFDDKQRVVHQESSTLPSLRINTAHLKKGLYIVNVTSINKEYKERLLID